MKKGFFIVLEGPDRCGKSTQARLLAKWLRKKGLETVHTREPGGTPFAEAIRKILLDPRNRVLPLSEILLYEAARAQHTFELIVPNLKRGKVVLSERYTMATTAYQGYGRGLALKAVNALNKIATGGLKPRLTLVLDMPDREFHIRGEKIRSDRLEQESSGFRLKVRRAYRRLARSSRNVFPVDASKSVDKVHKAMTKIVERHI
ncbi:unnamed protein product [marine sediment metagenome]|uniref:dTMP kinase n=1 Tax=marine sediment metagenome TaxID=412755 RepID=X0RM69_9ZZZZ